jgi:transposase-like protein
MRNVLKVRRADQPTVKTDLQAVIYQNLTPGTLGAPLADRWEPDYPKAVACLRDDLDELLTLVPQIPRSAQTARDYQRIERRFREVRRRTRPRGVFSDRTSIDRILFVVFNHENRNQGVSTPLLLTQTLACRHLTSPRIGILCLCQHGRGSGTLRAGRSVGAQLG